jgi:ketosteroid isomerase-like protein
MSEGDVEVVRGFWDACARSFEAYWEDPRPLVQDLQKGTVRPESRAVFEFLNPELVWSPAFLGQERHGMIEMAETWDDYLSWADDYRVVRLEEATDLDDGRVLTTVRLSYRAKAGGGDVEGPLFTVFTIADGLITRIDEYTERSDALEAAGP